MDIYDVLFISFLGSIVFCANKFKLVRRAQTYFGRQKEDAFSPLDYLTAIDPLTGGVCEREEAKEEKSFGWGDFYDVRIPVRAIQEFENAKENCPKEHPQRSEILKQLLLRRTISSIPCFRRIQTETPEMEACFKRGTLPEKNWNEVKAAWDWMNEEFVEIRAEADLLIDGWSKEIIPYAVHVYDSTIQQQREEAQKSQAEQNEREVKKEQLIAAKQEAETAKQRKEAAEIKAAKSAEKNAAALLEEEEKGKTKIQRPGLTNRKRGGSQKTPPVKSKIADGFKKGFLN